MPSRVPSQNTRQPRATSLAATANPGKTWPPVPPAVIITVPVTLPPRNALRASPPEGAARPWGGPAAALGGAHTVKPLRSLRFS